MRRRHLVSLCTALVLPAVVQGQTPQALVDTALQRMGGRARLAGIERVRMEFLTMWQQTAFDAPAAGALPTSYEWHTEWRDYTIPAWRFTRRFLGPTGWSEVPIIVRDSVAIIRPQQTWQPHNIAYVDERDELFAITPERILLLAQSTRRLADTLIHGVPHARVEARVDRFPGTLFFRRTDGYLAAFHFRAGQPNDFGLSPWGVMDVEVQYSRWASLPGGVILPRQWDVLRVGRPYKRITLVGAEFNPVIAADTLAIPAELRTRYLAEGRKPMWERPDADSLHADRIVDFGPFAGGAVRFGNAWLLLEPGAVPEVAERRAHRLMTRFTGTRLGGAVVTRPAAGNGAVTGIARDLPIHIAPGFQPFAEVMLQNRGVTRQLTPVTSARWVRVESDSVWVAPIDLPDQPGAMYLYVPSLRWAYSGAAAGPVQWQPILAAIRARGWPVTHTNSPRSLWTPVPGAP